MSLLLLAHFPIFSFRNRCNRVHPRRAESLTGDRVLRMLKRSVLPAQDGRPRPRRRVVGKHRMFRKPLLLPAAISRVEDRAQLSGPLKLCALRRQRHDRLDEVG